MFQAKQRGEYDTACEKSRSFARDSDRQNQDSVEEAIVLEMNVVND